MVKLNGILSGSQTVFMVPTYTDLLLVLEMPRPPTEIETKVQHRRGSAVLPVVQQRTRGQSPGGGRHELARRARPRKKQHSLMEPPPRR
jgi:hypothetical protein